MITLQHVYYAAGLLFAAYAVLGAFDRANPKRWRNSVFWGLFALSFLAGDRLGDLGNGFLVLGLVAIAGIGGLGRGAAIATTPEQRRELSARYGERLFIPALTIPAVTLFGSLVLKEISIGGQPLLQTTQATLISLALGVAVAIAVAAFMFRPPALAPVQEGRRLMDTVGWAAVLPQMLASLGAVFALAGVGTAIADVAGWIIPADSRLFAVVAYCVGMALFTVVMGNAFAAFPVMTAGIGLPLIVGRFGGDPVVMSAVGMLCGFCGTLCTPMAANFNIVPAALLELKDRYGVIRAQIPTAVPLLIANIVLMYLTVYRV